MGLDRSIAWLIIIPLLHAMVQSGDTERAHCGMSERYLERGRLFWGNQNKSWQEIRTCKSRKIERQVIRRQRKQNNKHSPSLSPFSRPSNIKQTNQIDWTSAFAPVVSEKWKLAAVAKFKDQLWNLKNLSLGVKNSFLMFTISMFLSPYNFSFNIIV